MEKTKTKFSRRSIALLLALVLVVGFLFAVPTRAADTGSLGKLVDYFSANSSSFTLDSSSRFFIETEPTGDVLQTIQLAQRQFAADGIPSSTPLDIVWGKASMVRDGDIYIQLVEDDSNISTEGYKLIVTSYATVIAEDVDGLLYGLNQLQKHFRAAKSTTIKGFTTYDTPDTVERTVQLDCARKYLTVEYVCNFIKEASWMGYNALQLHVSEDGGFRADFWDDSYFADGYTGDYKPNNDFTWLCGSQVQSWVYDESDVSLPNYRDDPDANKYLTTAELIQIIDTCKEYHMEVIPSFDSPGHMDYLTWKFEQNYKSNTSYSFTYNGTTYKASATSGCINYSGKTGGVTPLWPYYTSMDIRDTTTRGKMSQAFVFSIYEDMASFFKIYAGSTKFNIGTDEVNLTNSSISSTAWSYDLFPGFVNELNALLKGYGYTCRMFNDFINDSNISSFDSDIEILYWNSPYNSISGTAGAYDEPSVSSFVNNNRILYNCINQHTYYVLRVAPNGKGGAGGGLNPSNGDARSANCYQWEFYGADEDSIYNDWAPNNIRKKGLYTEPDAIVPDDQLGGAYFLTWHDYAAVNTETEMWNGVWDTVNNSGEFYSVRSRMWSNIIKQWNWDINTTSNSMGQLTFANFETIRDSLGDFPGLEDDTYEDESYAKATTLPAATDPIQLADHTELTEALANKIEQGVYTDKSYNVYLAAYDKADTINNNNRASAEELGAALTNLQNAIDQLVVRTDSFTITWKSIMNGNEHTIQSKTYAIPVNQTTFNLFIPAMKGYTFLNVQKDEDGNELAVFTPDSSGDGSGYLSGTFKSDVEIVLLYQNNANASFLYDLIEESIEEQGKFTNSSWQAYTAALEKAKKFTMSSGTSQEEIDALITALQEARSALVTSSASTTISVEKLTGTFRKGEQIGLHILTTPNVSGLTITSPDGEVEPDFCSGEVQELTSGETVKIWLVFFTVDEAGTYTYSIGYNSTSTDVTITIV